MKASKILNDAWLRIEIPSAISEQYEIFKLISDDVHGVLFPYHSLGFDKYALWIKALNPPRDRRALGVILSGDDVETLIPGQAHDLLQRAVNAFMEQSVAFEEAGILPEPLQANLFIQHS